MSYFPVPEDRSGQILASGIAGAAQTNQQAMGQLGQDIGGVIQQFAGMYAENKALDAKAGAYKGFLKEHGSQLGLNPQWIESMLKAPRADVLAAGDILTGSLGNRYFGYNYLVKQNELYPRSGGGGTGAGGAGGGDYVVGGGWGG